MIALDYYKLCWASPMPQPSSQEEEHKMAEYDLIVRNGTIVDGTGGIPAYRGDVAVKDGKIAMISGRIKATAMKEVDATGCIVAPGAIDLLNHYDLQLNWDRLCNDVRLAWRDLGRDRPMRLRVCPVQAEGSRGRDASP